MRFTGRVLEYVTQSPVAAAAVTYTLDSPDGQSGPSRATTNPDGVYVVTVPRTGVFTVTVDGAFAGTARVNGTAYRGDLFIRGGTCISRYGLIIDRRTLRPIGGASVMLVGRTVTTGSDGWYRIDIACPDIVFPGGTTIIVATHPDYQTRSQVVGRGVSGVTRLDLDLARR